MNISFSGNEGLKEAVRHVYDERIFPRLEIYQLAIQTRTSLVM